MLRATTSGAALSSARQPPAPSGGTRKNLHRWHARISMSLGSHRSELSPPASDWDPQATPSWIKPLPARTYLQEISPMFRSLRVFVAWMLMALLTGDMSMACRWSCGMPCRPMRCYATCTAPPISYCCPGGSYAVREMPAPSAPRDAAPEPYTTRQPVIEEPASGVPEPAAQDDALVPPQTVEAPPLPPESESPPAPDVPAAPADAADVAVEAPEQPPQPAAEKESGQPPIPAAIADQPPERPMPQQPAAPQDAVDRTETPQPDVAETPQPPTPAVTDAPEEPDDAAQQPAEPKDDLFDSLLEPKATSDEAADLFGAPPSAEPMPEAPAEQMPAPEEGAPEEGVPEEPAPDEFDSLFDDSTRRAPEHSRGGLAAFHVVRHWVDNTGQYACDGRLLRLLDGEIRILKINGRTATVPLERLSQADLRYVAQAGTPRAGGQMAQADAATPR